MNVKRDLANIKSHLCRIFLVFVVASPRCLLFLVVLLLQGTGLTVCQVGTIMNSGDVKVSCYITESETYMIHYFNKQLDV